MWVLAEVLLRELSVAPLETVLLRDISGGTSRDGSRNFVGVGSRKKNARLLRARLWPGRAGLQATEDENTTRWA